MKRVYVSPATSILRVVVESNLMASSAEVSGTRIDDVQVSVNTFSETIENYSFNDINFD
ncbi:MAG: hypothetical protein HUJ93_06390 [Bacteroidales bacterium]|nr:hypothetical protein [Bacteroidales bacterium]